MSLSATYTVSSKGGVATGFETPSVVSAFSALFGVPEEKAAAFVEKQKLIKKNLNASQAKAYQEKLSGIGLPVLIETVEPDDGLALVAEDAVLGSESGQASAAKPAHQFECPKCSFAQQRAEQCSACGIYIEKFLAANNSIQHSTQVPAANAKSREKPISNASRARAAREDRESDNNTVNLVGESELTPKIIGAAVLAAALGALLWGLTLGSWMFESSIIRYVVAIMIGLAAVIAGGRGASSGKMCVGLFFVAVVLGRLIGSATIAADTDVSAWIADATSDFSSIQEGINVEAQLFADASKNNASLKQFLLDEGHIDASEFKGISDAELEEYKVAFGQFYSLFDVSESNGESPDVLAALAIQEIPKVSMWDVFKQLMGFFGLLHVLIGAIVSYYIGRGTSV